MKKEEIKRMNDLYHLSQERDLSEENSPNGRVSKSSMSPIQGEPYSPARQYIYNRRKGNKRKLEKKSGDK